MAESEEKPVSKGISEGLRDAIEGAFAATERTRDRAQGLTQGITQGLSGKTRERAQELVDEVSRRGQDALGSLEGMRLVSRDELASLQDEIDEIRSRVAKLEANSKSEPEG